MAQRYHPFPQERISLGTFLAEGAPKGAVFICTAVTYRTGDHYFGRNLDLAYSYHETVTITPRKFPLSFRRLGTLSAHYAMIGMAHISEGYPLYYDAVNEGGLAMAGLNFPGFAHYGPPRDGADNIAPFELIPWILGRCARVEEAVECLDRAAIVNLDFSPALPVTPLHWLLADRERAVVIEPRLEGLRVFEDPVGVLANAPGFEYHMQRLADCMGLTAGPPANTFAEGLDLRPYSLGMGAMGLPGDLSSSSRFLRAAFTKCNSVSGPGEDESVSQMFHILGAVAQPRGCNRLEDDSHEITQYTACCNTDRGVYYYTTYENPRITAVDMNREDLDGRELTAYPLAEGLQVYRQN